MSKDILGFQIMADAQKSRYDAINKARIEASPWLQAVLANVNSTEKKGE
jgi:hypothetical protein